MSSNFIFKVTPVAAIAIAVCAANVVAAQTVLDANIASSLSDQRIANVQYQSAFSDYVPYSEQSIESWRQANDTVGEIGGWRTYAKEARQTIVSADQVQLNTSSLERPDTKEVKR